MTQDAWNPQQYEKFKNERSQPFFDLITLVKTVESPRVIDLGCGTGELTAHLHQHTKAHSTTGLDSSDEMLKKTVSHVSEGLIFAKGSIESWEEPKKYDIILSNAALQWCSNHQQIFQKIRNSLRSHGQLAIQMPINHDYPTHVIASQMSQQKPWATLLKNQTYEKQQNVLLPEEYAELLFKLGFQEQNVFVKVYAHKLESREHVIEWVKGTLLTHFQSRLSEDQYKEFLKEFRTRLFEKLADDKPFFYPFKRLFIWGRLPL